MTKTKLRFKGNVVGTFKTKKAARKLLKRKTGTERPKGYTLTRR